MKLTVTKDDGTDDVFGDVMGINADAESAFLTVGYGISNAKVGTKTFSKTYQTGRWKKAVIEANAPVNYSQPDEPA